MIAEEPLDDGAGERVDAVAEVRATDEHGGIAGDEVVEAGLEEGAAQDVPAIAGEAGLEKRLGEHVAIAGPEDAGGPDAGGEIGSPDAAAAEGHDVVLEAVFGVMEGGGGLLGRKHGGLDRKAKAVEPGVVDEALVTALLAEKPGMAGGGNPEFAEQGALDFC